MTKFHFNSAYNYSIRDSMKTLLIFIAVMILIFMVKSIVISLPNITIQTAGVLEVSSTITIFIIGIVSVRENLRMFIQNGIGRRTAYFTNLSVAVTLALILSIAGELILGITQTIIASPEILSFYQMIFNQGSIELTFAQRLASFALNFSFYVFAYIGGMLISLIFYRLSKPWNLVVAIGVPVFFIIILPLIRITTIGANIISWLSRPLHAVIDWTITSSGNMAICTLILCIIIALFCRLLFLRVPIK